MVGTKEAMTLERAEEINKAMTKLTFLAMGIDRADETMVREKEKQLFQFLHGLTLQEMLDATRMIESDNAARMAAAAAVPGTSYSIAMVCADRLVAAIHVLVNFPRSNEPIVSIGETAVGVVRVERMDEVDEMDEELEAAV